MPPPPAPKDAPGALRLDLGEGASVAALVDTAARPQAACVLAHGAGAGMHHAFMAAAAAGLAARGVHVLRYQFPFMERGGRRPDPPALAQATVRAAVGLAARRWPGLPLVAGGKSFGARMTSQAHAAAPLAGVAGLLFLGFPLHPAGRPSATRAAHLDAVALPMLFLQGERDRLAEPAWLQPVIERLGTRASLHAIPDADHAFHVPVRSGRRDDEVLASMLDAAAAWISRLPVPPPPDDAGARA